jgi:hypothetical protein
MGDEQHGMPSERWLQASYEIEEQITTRIFWKNFYPHIRNPGVQYICENPLPEFSSGLLSRELVL